MPIFNSIAPVSDVSTQIYCGDMVEEIESNDWHSSFQMVFVDSPFNIGHGYDVYNDNLSLSEFGERFADWVSHAAHCVCPGGYLLIHCPDDMVQMALNAATVLSLRRVDWIVWHYAFGQCQRSRFINSKAHCLVFWDNRDPSDWDCVRELNDNNRTWNPDAVLVDSLRATKYNDLRTEFTDTPGQRVPFDVWCTEYDGKFWGRVQGNNKEREGMENHPNQLPEVYLERLIKAYTNPNDWLLDCFGGTGTLAVVAKSLQRNSITLELSQPYCDDIMKRLHRGRAR